ncbi:MAG TPA: multidrug effflux MFS transporter [Polyangiaceae bacterium]|nr:multidrug effflux MFS transporter [Polyangiaceae bacterium]
MSAGPGASAPAARPAAPPRQGPALELLLGTLTAFAPLSVDMYLPAFPSIGRELGAGPARVQLTLASFFVGLSLGQFVTGPFIDRFGRTRPLYAGLALYVAASLGCALSPSIAALTAFRVAQAVGGAVALVVARAVVRDLHSGAAAARMLSRLALVMGVAPIVAPLVGGLMLKVAGWRAIFVVLAAVGALTLAASVAALPETAPPQPGGARLRLPLGEVLRAPGFLGYALTAACAQAGMFAYIAGSSFVFITLHGVPAQSFGWFFGANAAGFVASAQVNRRLLARRPPERVLRGALRAAALAGLLLVAGAATGAGGVWGVWAPLFVFLCSLGFIVPNATALSLEHQVGRVGTASAVLGTLLHGAAAGSSSAVSAAHDGTALPMALIVTGAAFLAWASPALARGAPAPPGA